MIVEFSPGSLEAFQRAGIATLLLELGPRRSLRVLKLWKLILQPLVEEGGSLPGLLSQEYRIGPLPAPELISELEVFLENTPSLSVRLRNTR
jgi:hypothetical protein